MAAPAREPRPPAGHLRSLLAAVVLLVLAGLGYWAGRAWLEREDDYRRVPLTAGCDLRAGPCGADVAGGTLSFSIAPRQIPLMQPLSLAVEARDLGADAVRVTILGTNMDMGLNRTALRIDQDGVWRGETILPICSQRRMDWEALVAVDGAERFELAFPFSTERP